MAQHLTIVCDACGNAIDDPDDVVAVQVLRLGDTRQYDAHRDCLGNLELTVPEPLHVHSTAEARPLSDEDAADAAAART